MGSKLDHVEVLHRLFSNQFSENGWFDSRSQLHGLHFPARFPQVNSFLFLLFIGNIYFPMLCIKIMNAKYFRKKSQARLKLPLINETLIEVNVRS